MAQSNINNHQIKHTQLLNTVQITGTGDKTLSKSASNFDAVILEMHVNSNDYKTVYIPKESYGKRVDCSYPATDSLSWYLVLSVTVSDTTAKINKISMSGYSACYLAVYGVEVI